MGPRLWNLKASRLKKEGIQFLRYLRFGLCFVSFLLRISKRAPRKFLIDSAGENVNDPLAQKFLCVFIDFFLLLLAE